MSPTVDAFRALARSAPWRSRTLHFTYATGTGERPATPSYDECWLERPDRLTVLDAAGRRHRLSEPSAGRGSGSTVVFVAADAPLTDAEIADLTRQAERSPGSRYDDDVPMWDNYYFVAALVPVELSHSVRVEGLRADTVAGRPVWRADLTPVEGYDPRCGGNCCELLWSEVSWRADGDDGPIPGRVRFPEHYDVALDAQTGVVVRSLPVGGADAPWLEIDILEVDADPVGAP